MIDLHCHILPGLDDGARSLEESIKMAMVAEKDGIKKIVATPHLFRDNLDYEDLNIIEEKKDELNKVLEHNSVHIEILAGAEVHISHNLIEQIRKNRNALTLHHSSYMFIEFPHDHVFSGVKELFFELMTESITPVIAHPERNSVFIHNPALLYDLIQMGALAQANSGSFLRMYGSEVQRAVFHFLGLNLIQFIGSDGHDSRSKAPKLREAVKAAADIVGDERANALVRENPQAVLGDQELPYLPEPVYPEERGKKLRIKLPFLRVKNKT